MQEAREHLLEIYQAALDIVSGRIVVSETLLAGQDKYPDFFHVISIGKAAEAMVLGVPPERIKSGLLITKHGHTSEKLQNNPLVRCIESDHPIPQQASLSAGQVLLDYLQSLPKQEPCLFLISGGTSALVEVLHDEWDLSQLQALTDHLLANAYSIDDMNAVRRCISKIKGGGLWSFIGDRPVDCLMISDVPDDNPAIIGSGLLFPIGQSSLPKLPSKWLTQINQNKKVIEAPESFNWNIIASLTDAKNAAAIKAQELGYKTRIITEFVSGDAQQMAKSCIDSLQSEPDTLFIWGGETTVNLPQKVGMGGRNQHLALAAAIEMNGIENTILLAAGTDGSDGSSAATGAIVDSVTLQRGFQSKMDALDYLQRADSGSFFKKTDEQIVTGATGTNVMDLVIGIQKSPL